MVSGSLVPRLSPASVMSSLKLQGQGSLIARAAAGDEASFRSVRYLERCKNALGPRVVSVVRSLEVVASRRLPMYYKYGIFNP